MNEVEIAAGGRVQGVNFRNMCRNFCYGKGIAGYIMNRNDGSVFINAQGEKKELNGLISWLQSNPGLAKVRKLSCKWKKIEIKYKEFTIKRQSNYVMDRAKGIMNFVKKDYINSLKNKTKYHMI